MCVFSPEKDPSHGTRRMGQVAMSAMTDRQYAYLALTSAGAVAALFAVVLVWGFAARLETRAAVAGGCLRNHQVSSGALLPILFWGRVLLK